MLYCLLKICWMWSSLCLKTQGHHYKYWLSHRVVLSWGPWGLLNGTTVCHYTLCPWTAILVWLSCLLVFILYPPCQRLFSPAICYFHLVSSSNKEQNKKKGTRVVLWEKYFKGVYAPDVLSSPMAKIPGFQGRRYGFSPLSGNWGPTYTVVQPNKKRYICPRVQEKTQRKVGLYMLSVLSWLLSKDGCSSVSLLASPTYSWLLLLP